MGAIKIAVRIEGDHGAAGDREDTGLEVAAEEDISTEGIIITTVIVILDFIGIDNFKHEEAGVGEAVNGENLGNREGNTDVDVKEEAIIISENAHVAIIWLPVFGVYLCSGTKQEKSKPTELANPDDIKIDNSETRSVKIRKKRNKVYRRRFDTVKKCIERKKRERRALKDGRRVKGINKCWKDFLDRNLKSSAHAKSAGPK
ncbi:unnamed protein product [Cylicocyclus nassatus]|uniref:Uncharacterized protein n=1 Tax=Cylicocyclus nassatus TaxID=53992 RepID=A0AA36GX71_CYLNA|nr:unnamed protein product [Cylicocyclus nassatus]